MSSNHILQLKVNNKEKVYKRILPQSTRTTWIKKHKKKKEIPWSAVIYSYMGLKGSEYHTSNSVSQSTLTHAPRTHIN